MINSDVVLASFVLVQLSTFARLCIEMHALQLNALDKSSCNATQHSRIEQASKRTLEYLFSKRTKKKSKCYLGEFDH